jgi:hypothetical protein
LIRQYTGLWYSDEQGYNNLPDPRCLGCKDVEGRLRGSCDMIMGVIFKKELTEDRLAGFFNSDEKGERIYMP